MNEPEKTWHVSSLTKYLMCGEAYRRSEIERDRPPPTTPQIRGGAVHRGIASGLIEQQSTQAIAPVELYEDVTATQIDLQVKAGVTLTAEEASTGKTKVFGALKDKAVKYAGGYAKQVATAIVPVAVERRVAVRGLLPNTLLRGTVDLIDQTIEHGEVIRDTKTTERMPSDNAADLSSQLTMYAMLRNAEIPRIETPVSLDFLVMRASGAVEHKRLTSARGPEQFAALTKRIAVASRSLNAGVFLPANPETAWWCSEKFCAYWHTCPYVAPYRKEPA